MKGVDSSILVYALDPTTKEHARARDAILSLESWALNPTVAHEVYHTLVFKRGMKPKDGRSKLKAAIRDRRARFMNITKSVSLYSLDLASEYSMGGRDSLIVGCYMTNGIETMLTHDLALLGVGKIVYRGRQIAFNDPLS